MAEQHPWIPEQSQVRIGIVTQGHVPTIERMLEEGASWPDIGRAINWDPATAAQHYANYAYRQLKSVELALVTMVQPAQAGMQVSEGSSDAEKGPLSCQKTHVDGVVDHVSSVSVKATLLGLREETRVAFPRVLFPENVVEGSTFLLKMVPGPGGVFLPSISLVELRPSSDVRAVHAQIEEMLNAFSASTPAEVLHETPRIKPFLVDTSCAGLPGSTIAATVLSTHFVSPLDKSEALERALSELGVKGMVLFDMLMTNGTRRNRLFKCPFDGNEFDFRQCKALADSEDVGYDYRTHNAGFYRDHLEDVDPSLLSPAMRFAVKRGVPL